MRSILLFSTILLILSFSNLFSQQISSVEFIGSTVIPFEQKVDGINIGGLSAIAYSAEEDLYYLVADKPPSRIYQLKIEQRDGLNVEIKQVLYLNPPLLKSAELEGIVINPKTNNFYLSDEQSSGTRIIEVDNKAKFISIVKPLNQGFLPLSGHNSGIEGLTLSHDSNHLYFAFERPTSACFDQSLTLITRLNIGNDQVHKFYYRLHNVANDKLNTNGISEILYLNESTLLIMERAYIYAHGNVVRLYQANIKTYVNQAKRNCDGKSLAVLTSTLLFDFGKVKDFKVDNAEGMTFNADKSILFIVTDNNFSKKQQTQIIALKVNWK